MRPQSRTKSAVDIAMLSVIDRHGCELRVVSVMVASPLVLAVCAAGRIVAARLP
jgi:hypothetical protein